MQIIQGMKINEGINKYCVSLYIMQFNLNHIAVDICVTYTQIMNDLRYNYQLNIRIFNIIISHYVKTHHL